MHTPRYSIIQTTSIYTVPEATAGLRSSATLKPSEMLELRRESTGRSHHWLDGVRHPEGHEAVVAVAAEVVGVMKEAKGGPGLEDSRGAERMVEATEPRFSTWRGNVRMMIQMIKNIMSANKDKRKRTVISERQMFVQFSLLKGNSHR